jgi:hypothetical protein
VASVGVPQNPKFQIPRKSQGGKSQKIPKKRGGVSLLFPVCDLEIYDCLGFGVWDFSLSPRSLSEGQVLSSRFSLPKL